MLLETEVVVPVLNFNFNSSTLVQCGSGAVECCSREFNVRNQRLKFKNSTCEVLRTKSGAERRGGAFLLFLNLAARSGPAGEGAQAAADFVLRTAT
ncbi:hypothetical protein EVAR_26847_1 [Eumeta japonica]|uniref:Uncharacterized protein n=1 Tax=Eumeta variegata TaxID=151549 RepID=A0A4C1VXV3_EUMVA|nr:hypothetical protein EVAR_26847_1 [Eumeta japonica]